MALTMVMPFKGDISTGEPAAWGHKLGQSPRHWAVSRDHKVLSSGASAHQEESQGEQTLNKKAIA